MRALVQRVTAGAVRVEGEVVGEIGAGLVIFVGVGDRDGEAEAAFLAGKVAALRIFGDEAGKMNRSLADVGGEILAVSQFTLAGSIARGRRPSFDNAEEPERARALFELFVRELGATGIAVKTGRFREMMLVSIENDGPVTFVW